MQHKRLHRYNPLDHEVLWDVQPASFVEGGNFDKFRNALRSGSYTELVYDEAIRVSHFLSEWESQLKLAGAERFVTCFAGFQELFRRMPKLSGVVYLSHNVVVSEALFDASREGEEHLTSRMVNRAIQDQLPWTSELTFSFPRKYSYFGYLNSWGFIRIPRKDDSRNDAGVLISCTTLDPKVMEVFERTGFQHLANMYNRVWDDAIHDYLHHIVLYTNPSFGIGRLSPMSIAGLNGAIDEWGTHINNTFNYEYWAHRSHRLITEKTLTEEQRKIIIDAACGYVREVYRFHDCAIEAGFDVPTIKSMVMYLIAIYLWPTSILLHPESEWVKELGKVIGSGPFQAVENPTREIAMLLLEMKRAEDPAIIQKLSSGSRNDNVNGLQDFIKDSKTPIEMAIAGSIKSANIDKWYNNDLTINFYDWLRCTVDIIGYRGLYECWYHNHPIYYKNEEIQPHEATLKLLEKLQTTFDAFEHMEPKKYFLRGIVS